MARSKIERALREAGMRKKRGRKVARAADRSRSGDRAARKLVDEQAAALRNSISAVVRHAETATAKAARNAAPKKRPARKRPARKASSKSDSAKRASAQRSASKSTRRKTAR